jgi:hypothetical protein
MSHKRVDQREYGTELKLATVRRVLAGGEMWRQTEPSPTYFLWVSCHDNIASPIR